MGKNIWYSMIKERKTILIISISILILFLISILIFFIINNNNKKLKDGELVISIYQYDVVKYNIDFNSERVLLYQIDFNEDTVFDEIIYSKDHTLYNHVVIQNGICKVVDANCLNHICMNSYISCDKEIINTRTITCMPSGLYIVLENK